MLSQFDEAGLYGFILAGGNNNRGQLNEILVRGKTIHLNRPSHFQFREMPHANWSKFKGCSSNTFLLLLFALFLLQKYNSVTHALEVLPQTMQTGRDVTFSTMVDVSLFPEAPAAP
jgi:hypothetical protein